MQLGIRDKLALLSLLISLMGLLVVGVVLHQTTTAELQAGIERNLLSYSELQHLRVQAFIHQQKEHFLLIATDPRLHDALQPYYRQDDIQAQQELAFLLASTRQVLPEFQEIALVSIDGVLLASSSDDWPPDPDDLGSFAAEYTEPKFKLCQVSGASPKLCWIGAVVLEGERPVMLLALSPLEPLDKLLTANVPRGLNTGTILSRRLLDGQVEPILPLRERQYFKDTQKRGHHPFYLAHITEENRVLAVEDMQGNPLLAVTRSLDDVDWALTVKVHRGDALAALDRQRETLIKLLLFLLIVAIVLSLWFASSLTRPISKLTATAMQIAGGDLKHRIRVNRSDEIGMLGLAFNQMADRLVAANESLEERVRAKNAELVLLNRRLSEANENLEQQVMRDRLTGVGNRRAFDRAIYEEWRRCRRECSPMTLLFLDVDYFKGFNDMLGHPTGDKALRSIAQVLSTHARRPGDMAARYGGDEFVLLLPNVTLEQAKQVATDIQEGLRERNIPHPCSQAAKRVTLSIGIASMIPSEATQPAQLVRAADEALYYAKAQGRNCWYAA